MCVSLQCSCQNKFVDTMPCLLLTRFNVDDYMHTLIELCGLYALLYTALTNLCEITWSPVVMDNSANAKQISD